MEKTTTFYGTFNARNLSPIQIAERFVENEEFGELLTLNHTILMGARGSGKTTMFKMLTLPAIYNWKDDKAKIIKENLPFFAIYIPTDIHWFTQYSHYQNELKAFPILNKRLSEVLVSTNVFCSLCHTIINIFKYRVAPDSEKQIELAKILIKAFRLSSSLPTIECINEALYERVSDINLEVRKIIHTCPSDKEVNYSKFEYFDLDYLSVLSQVFVAFERLFPSDDSYKWALCFDELELAPEWLRRNLYYSLRSTDQKIIFKLSSSPIISISEEIPASSGHDVKLIRMWPHSKKSFDSFCDSIVKSILKKNNINIAPDDLFGKSPIYSPTENDLDINEYDQGSPTWKKIKDLAKVDKSLYKLLKKHQINPENPIAIDKSQLDTVLRKIKQTVYFRSELIKKNKDGKNEKRSRKVSPLFYGKEVIYSISDGNPRWLIGIINDLLKEIPKKNNETISIKPNTQSTILEKASKRFFALISAPPEASTIYKGKRIYLHSIIENIADYFYKNIVFDDFPLDPKGSFIVDLDDKEILTLLEFALYQGAIVLIDPSEDTFDSNIYKKRFRLSFLLAPRFKLPLRTYNPSKLSECIKPSNKLITQQEVILFE